MSKNLKLKNAEIMRAEYVKDNGESEDDTFLKLLDERIKDLKENTPEFSEVKHLYRQIRDYEITVAALQISLQEKIKDLSPEDLKKFNSLVVDENLKSAEKFCNCNDTDTSDCIIEGH